MKKRLKWLIPLSAVAIVAAIAVGLFLSNGYVYWSPNVTVQEVDPSPNRIIAHAEWLPRTAEDIFGNTKIIAKGTVKNIREIKVSYDNYGQPGERVYTLFDFHVSEYLKNTSSTKRNKSVLTVGWLYSSYCYSPEVPVLEEGSEYLFFFEVPAEDAPKDALDRKNYTDVWARSPQLAAFKKGVQGYSVNSYFLEYFQEDQRANISGNLENAIKEKVKEYAEVG